MIRHILQLCAASALIIVCMLLPFLPGRYEGLAVTLSSMAQMFGVVGLVLVPLGGIWLWLAGKTRSHRFEFWLALASFGVSTIIATFLAIIALIEVGFALAVMMAAIWVCLAARLMTNLKNRHHAESRPFNPMPLYLIVLPVVAAITRVAAVDRMAEFSRARVIENSAPLIRDIERYRERIGHYPPFLLSVNKDYHPGVIGVDRYHYAPNRGAYNIVFEHMSNRLGIREFFVYNPRDEQVMTSHALDLLELTPAQLEVEWTRGHNEVHDAPQPHWKYFWFD